MIGQFFEQDPSMDMAPRLIGRLMPELSPNLTPYSGFSI